jgi:hypothetical protein
VSYDGVTWAPITTVPWVPAVNASAIVRDPSIFYNFSTGLWMVAYTNNIGNQTFSVISSPDLLNWTEVHDVDCSGVTTYLCEAPSWFTDSDGSIHIMMAANQNSGGTLANIYEVHPTNAAMTTWSTPSLIGGLENNVIDPFETKAGGSTYNLFYKNNTTGYVEYATNSTLTGTYTQAQTGNWASWGTPWEGPNLVQMSATDWRVYLDDAGSGSGPHSMFYSDSMNNWSTWTTPAPINSPYGYKHMNVYQVSDLGLMRNVLTAYASSQRKTLVLGGQMFNNALWNVAAPALYIMTPYGSITGNTAIVSDSGAGAWGVGYVHPQASGLHVGIASSSTLPSMLISTGNSLGVTPSPIELQLANATGNSSIRLGQSGTYAAYISWNYNSTGTSAYWAFGTLAGRNNIIFFPSESAGNVGIGTTSFGTSAYRVLGLGLGTAPTTAPSGVTQVYSSPLDGAGKAELGIYQQYAPETAAGVASTNCIPVTVNGTHYCLLATTAQ